VAVAAQGLDIHYTSTITGSATSGDGNALVLADPSVAATSIGRGALDFGVGGLPGLAVVLSTVRVPGGAPKNFVGVSDGTQPKSPKRLHFLATSTALPNLHAAVAMRVDGKLCDLKAPLPEGAQVAVVTSKDPAALEVIRHSTAHLLAQAVKRLFPKAKVGIGPVIEDGFYYDFMVEPFFTPEDLVLIETEMRRISQEAMPVVREELGRNQAIERFKAMGEGLKVELVSDIPDDELRRLERECQGDLDQISKRLHVSVRALQLRLRRSA